MYIQIYKKQNNLSSRVAPKTKRTVHLASLLYMYIYSILYCIVFTLCHINWREIRAALPGESASPQCSATHFFFDCLCICTYQWKFYWEIWPVTTSFVALGSFTCVKCMLHTEHQFSVTFEWLDVQFDFSVKLRRKARVKPGGEPLPTSRYWIGRRMS